jgi:hypothetical protein
MNCAEERNSIVRYADRELGKRWVPIEGEIKKLMKTNKVFRTRSMFLMYLIQEGPWSGKSDKHKTWSNWYCQQNLIVTSIGQEKMSQDTEVPIGTIKRWLKELEDEKLIKRKYEWGELVVIVGEIINGMDVYLYEMLQNPTGLKNET